MNISKPFVPLLAPLNIEILKMEHPSVRRNVLIADVFYRAGAIEAWGRGIRMMISESQKNNMPSPSFRIFAGGMEIVFSKMDKETKNGTDNDTDSDTDNDTDRKQEILKLIREDAKISAKQIAKHLSVSRITVLRDIKTLKALNKLIRNGSEKNGYWEVH